MPIPAEALVELKLAFLQELDVAFRQAEGHYATLEVDPAAAAPYEALEHFFHRIAGTAANVELPQLGHLAAVSERGAALGTKGLGSVDLARLVREGLDGVGAVLATHGPAARSARPGLSAMSSPAEADPGDEVARSQILVVDDDAFSAGLVESYLKAAGFRSAHCTEPARAFEVIQAEIPDLIILDVMMPGVDGFELCQKVRAHPALHLTPIIFLTRKGDVEQRIRGLEVGGNDYLSKPFDPDELVARVRSHLSRMAALRDLALRDGLTRCYNHGYFKVRLEQEVDRARRYKQGFALGLLDVDLFKRINDTHGHPAGDAVLMNLAGVISASVRSSDVVARYGGEEFGLLLVQAGMKEAELIAERTRERVAGHGFTGPGADRIPVTVSIGLTALTDDDTVESLVQRADDALYDAKAGGRNQVQVRLA